MPLSLWTPICGQPTPLLPTAQSAGFLEGSWRYRQSYEWVLRMEVYPEAKEITDKGDGKRNQNLPTGQMSTALRPAQLSLQPGRDQVPSPASHERASGKLTMKARLKVPPRRKEVHTRQVTKGYQNLNSDPLTVNWMPLWQVGRMERVVCQVWTLLAPCLDAEAREWLLWPTGP